MKNKKYDTIKQELIKYLHENKLTEEQIQAIALLFQKGAEAAIEDTNNAVNDAINSLKKYL